jgi:carbamoyltransferase
MIVWGISANSHDAALAVFKCSGKGNGTRKHLKLLFASHAERYSGIKNDPHLNAELISEAKKYGEPDEIIWYERPLLKTLRQFRAGQGIRLRENNIKHYLNSYGIHAPIKYVDHHHSHAAAGYYTSPFSEACIVSIDSIGEFATLSIWQARANRLEKVYTQSYPHSVGLWYSALTQRVGLKPQEDEYILMGMAAYGDPDRLYRNIQDHFIELNDPRQHWLPEALVHVNQNLHRGCQSWRPDLETEQDYFDIAAGAQRVYENIFNWVLQYASTVVPSKNLVLTGGCALNCSANGIAYNYFDNIWIMPNPGDAGSAIGAPLAHYNQHIKWPGPYLGHTIEGDYPVEEALHELLTTGIVGVANGAAEFGPRALGNRSLLADPRGIDIKDRVNEIKRRQKFRPFAPAILAEHVNDYFQGPTGPYMQYTSVCTDPNLPAVVHGDGTARVQTVSAKDNPGFRRLLERWYEETGCPILLNTSLNIKGKPIVNTLTDAEEFAKLYNIKVFTHGDKTKH